MSLNKTFLCLVFTCVITHIIFQYITSSDTDTCQQWEDCAYSSYETAFWDLKPAHSYTSNCVPGWNSLHKPPGPWMEPVSTLQLNTLYIEKNIDWIPDSCV